MFMAGTIRSTFIRSSPQSKHFLILFPLAALCLGQAETPNRKWTLAERLAPVHLEAVRQARLNFAKSRQPVLPVGIYRDIRTVVLVSPNNADGLLSAVKTAGMESLFLPNPDGIDITGRQLDTRLDPENSNEDERLNAAQEYSPERMAQWDAELEKRKLTGFAPFHAPNSNMQFEASLRSTVTHVLARQTTESALRQSLKEGRAYVAHDWLADLTGFVFVASNNLGVYQIGDTIPLFMDAKFTALLPIQAKLKLIHNGKTVSEASGSKLEFKTYQPGYYRLEA